ncbi:MULTISPECIES: hypothetical protein [unclassified Roseovarius]|uniref:hypothetical protein n=1 Tax=unclassified Roseovarius TaxID=2614913 RepID=UPI00273EA6FD|nr:MULTISPECIES: hypothetical protein [unclassified Roseovarius]
MPQNPGIKLPPERVHQLKSIGEKWNMNVVDVIGEMVNQQIEKGVIEPGVPGIEVSKHGKRFHFDVLNDLQETTQNMGDKLREDRLLAADEMRQLAKSLRESMGVPKGGDLLPTPKGFQLKRRGTSLKLLNVKTGVERTLAPGIARDIAQSINKKLNEVS